MNHDLELALFAVVAIVTIVAAGAFSRRLGVAAPIILILVGIGFSYIPGAPTQFDPELVLLGLLPPILYSASITVPVVDFRRNLRTIGALSVLLVVASAFLSGYVLFLLLPDLSLPAAIAVGAVISPPDAVAATAIGKRLGLPPRLVTILEGEGLVNDATALTLLRTAIAAVGATLSFWGAIGEFVLAVVLAVIIGFIVGWVSVWVRSKLPDTVLQTAISFAVPFVAFIPAEAVHASGVLAVVVAGLYTGHAGAKRFSAQARINERLNWRTVQFVLENVVFLIMGLQISPIIATVLGEDDAISLGETIAYGLIATVVLIAVRFLFLGPLVLLLRRDAARAERRHTRFGDAITHLQQRIEGDERFTARLERARREHTRRSYDLKELRAEGLGWRGGLVLGWSGMRGVVTLAAAQTLPTGDDWPYRPQLILIAFVVAVVTLVLQGGTLPALIRVTGIRGPDEAADATRYAQLLDELASAGEAAVDDPDLRQPDGSPYPDDLRARVREQTRLHASAAQERAESVDDLESTRAHQWSVLVSHTIEAQRTALLEARSDGSYPSRLIERAQVVLDLEQTRIESADGSS